MKRLLSAILALTMTLTLVPAVFAADTGEVIFEGAALDGATIYTNKASSSADVIDLTHADGVVEISEMNLRRYNVTGPNGPMLAVEFKVPVTGEYTISFKTDATGANNASTAAAPKVYISAVTVYDSTARQFSSFLGENPIEVGYFEFSKLTAADEYMPVTIDKTGNETSQAIKTKTLTANKHYMLILFCDGKSVELNPVTKGGTLDSADYIVSTSGIRLPNNTGAIDLKYKQNIRFTGIKFTPVTAAEDKELTNAFEVTKKPAEDYSEPSVITVSVNNAEISSVKNDNGTHTITAPETNAAGKNFLYWAKGLTANKKIISFSNVLSDYVPDAEYANYLIAVYEDDITDTAEYYNANGQRIATAAEPKLPSMAGYGEATGWAKYGDTNIYVAEYSNKKKPDDVVVTVNGSEKTVPYGTEITCTANGENFKCWTKSDINGKTEIVSVDKEYKFLAWENCSVEAVYEKHTYKGNKMKIIIDSFAIGNETGVMAEFIGFGNNAVEKGIMWNGEKIAMTKPGSQFSIIADEEGTYEGYAIVKNADGTYTEYTDGSFVK